MATYSDNAPKFKPEVIADWRRNDRERIRVALDRYNGIDTIDVRSWVVDANGEIRPTRTGITLSVVKDLLQLVKALNEALAPARERGLLPPESQDD
jgi:hypothetical protein